MKGELRVKRIYQPPSKDDGYRVFVERLWPRGVSRERAALDVWLKEIAPSTELRKWFNHEPAKWPEFMERYRSELDADPSFIGEILDRLAKGNVTLLYASREEEYNAANALATVIRKSKFKSPR